MYVLEKLKSLIEYVQKKMGRKNQEVETEEEIKYQQERSARR